jgi:hypothetical protein
MLKQATTRQDRHNRKHQRFQRDRPEKSHLDCTLDEIIQSMGLSDKDFFDEEDEYSHRMPVSVEQLNKELRDYMLMDSKYAEEELDKELDEYMSKYPNEFSDDDSENYLDQYLY